MNEWSILFTYCNLKKNTTNLWLGIPSVIYFSVGYLTKFSYKDQPVNVA
jgi:hypothetical protein